MTNNDKIKEAFFKVKACGWVESRRRNNTGIGKTFEDYVGVVENNLDEPDLFGYEIKSHRSESSSYVTLFTKSPSYPPNGANAYLKDNFGELYPNSTYKKLHTSMFANSYNSYKDIYSFRLINERSEEKIYIRVYDYQTKNLLSKDVFYTYSDLQQIMKKKLNNLLFVKAQRRFNSNNKEEFFFDAAEIYTEPSITNFLQMLDDGEIMYDIRMGAYQSGANKGKPHDHGSGFRIKEQNIIKLYSNKEVI